MFQPGFLIKTSPSLSEKATKFVAIVLPIVAGVVTALVLLLLYRRWRQREDKNVLKSKSVKIGADFQYRRVGNLISRSPDRLGC